MATSPKTGDLELGRKIAKRREDLGMSRKDLAAATSLSYAYISQIETGYRLPSSRHHVALAKVLGMSLDELFGAEDAPVMLALSSMKAFSLDEAPPARRPGFEEVVDRAVQELESLPASVRLEALTQVQLHVMRSMTEDRPRQ